MSWLIFIVITAVILAAYWESQKKKERGEKLDFIASAIPNFNPSVTINGIGNQYKFMVDNVNKKICYITAATKTIIPFEKIISVDYSENGTTLSSKSTIRTIGGTLLGGALAGGAGAIVGGLSGSSKQVQKIKQVQVKIRLRDISNPTLVIMTFDAAIMTTKHDGVKADDMEGYILKQGLADGKHIVDIISVIIDEVDNNNKENKASSIQTSSLADELKKLSDLKNEGILTQEEFDLKKAQFLSDDSNLHSKSNEENIITEDVLSPELRHLINEGRIIEAVKLYKDTTGVSLSEAKKYIDELK